MATVISITNLKGGAGKTTVAINLAGYLAKYNTVQLIDSDPQGSVLDWYAARKKNTTQKSLNTNLTVSEDLFDSSTLKSLPRKTKKFDYIVIDTPPEDDRIMRTALAVADFTIIPVKPSPYDIRSASKTINTIKEGIETKAIKVEPFLLISQLKIGTILAREMRETLKVFEIPILKTEIADRVSLTTAGIYGQTIFEHESASHKSVKEFNKLGREVRKWQA